MPFYKVYFSGGHAYGEKSFTAAFSYDSNANGSGETDLRNPSFKEIFNPETTPERLEELLSLIMKQPVKILQVLPNDSTRLADEASLLVTDIVVELADHSIACVEV